MSMDTRIILYYESQMYTNNFPFSVIEELNADPEFVWLDKLEQAGSSFTFIGWTDHYPYGLIAKSKADQILVNTQGSWFVAASAVPRGGRNE